MPPPTRAKVPPLRRAIAVPPPRFFFLGEKFPIKPKIVFLGGTQFFVYCSKFSDVLNPGPPKQIWPGPKPGVQATPRHLPTLALSILFPSPHLFSTVQLQQPWWRRQHCVPASPGRRSRGRTPPLPLNGPAHRASTLHLRLVGNGVRKGRKDLKKIISLIMNQNWISKVVLFMLSQGRVVVMTVKAMVSLMF